MDIIGLSEDKKFVTYELAFIQEIMHFLKEVNTDKSRKLLCKMICPCPKEVNPDEKEFYLRSLTVAERKALLYGSSLPKDSEILHILRKLDSSANSESRK